ncbi:MAG: hypothetical protein AAFS10_11355, partial [Myxococcota bacterium]
MWDILTRLLDPSGFPARWYCGQWSPELGWLTIGSDILIFIAYLSIPFVLTYVALKRKDFPYPTLFWWFTAFILACGATHLLEAIIFWEPLYRLQAVLKAIRS